MTKDTIREMTVPELEALTRILAKHDLTDVEKLVGRRPRVSRKPAVILPRSAAEIVALEAAAIITRPEARRYLKLSVLGGPRRRRRQAQAEEVRPRVVRNGTP